MSVPSLEVAFCWGVNNLIAPRCLRRLVGTVAAEVLSGATMPLTRPSVTRCERLTHHGSSPHCYDPLAPIRPGEKDVKPPPFSLPPLPPPPGPYLAVFTHDGQAGSCGGWEGETADK